MSEQITKALCDIRRALHDLDQAVMDMLSGKPLVLKVDAANHAIVAKWTIEQAVKNLHPMDALTNQIQEASKAACIPLIPESTQPPQSTERKS